MRKYLKYKCSVCARTQDRLVDTKVAEISKCSITLGCSGKLFPVKYSDRGDTIPDAAPSGVQNWYSRFDVVTSFKDAVASTASLTYGETAELILAAHLPDTVFGTNTVDVVFEISKSENRAFREYIFNTTTKTERVLGAESGVSKKTLRFVSTGALMEDVQVFVNGVEMYEGVDTNQFTISRNTNTVPSNVVVFNTPLIGANQIRIVVSKRDIPELITISFGKVSAQSELNSSWANVSSVSKGSLHDIYAFKFTDTNIPIGKTLKIKSVVANKNGVSAQVDLTDCMFMLSTGGEYIDRCLTVVGGLDILGSSVLNVVDHGDGVKHLECSEDLLTNLKTPLIPVLFKPDSLVKTTSASTNINHSSVYINGPDV